MNRSARPSRRLHHSATTAPPVHGASHGCCKVEQAPRRALTRHPWPPSVYMVARFTNSASCLVSGATPAKHQQVLRSFNPPTTNKANPALLAVGSNHPYASPQGEVRAGPSNITRHCAKWPHARASLVTAATSHNAALCVNGPEGMPPNPRRGLTGWLRVLSDPPPTPAVS